jgi:hypothetical protein
MWSGRESEQSYLDRMLLNSYEPIAHWADGHLPTEARLLIVGDSRGVYYPRTAFAASAFDEPFFAKAAREEKDAGGILRRLKEAGITHVVLNAPEGIRVSKEYNQYRLSASEWKKINDFEKTGLEPLYWKNYQAVYLVRERLQPTSSGGMNLFSFFAPEAYDFIRDFNARDYPKAETELSVLLSLFPREGFWLEKKAELRRAWGK